MRPISLSYFQSKCVFLMAILAFCMCLLAVKVIIGLKSVLYWLLHFSIKINRYPNKQKSSRVTRLMTATSTAKCVINLNMNVAHEYRDIKDRPLIINEYAQREYATLWESMNPICSFSWCLFLFLSLCLSFCLFSTGRINLVFDEFVSVSIYGLQSAKLNWFHTQSQRWSKREREIWRERAIHTAANISTKMSVQQNDSTLFESFMSRGAYFFCNCTLCALLMIGSPIPLSFSFCRFSFIHPKNVYGRFTSFSFWPSPIPCSMLFTQFLFFLSLSPFHTYTNEHIQKKNNDVDGDDP